MGTYVTQPLATSCKNLNEVQAFLRQCRYVSDPEQFNKRDHWMPPEEFEELKKGDCDDFALWTWRQFLTMGYEARFVVGRAGKYGYGHAWVTYTKNGRTYLVEPMVAWLGLKLPRLSTVRYQPGISVAWDGERLRYYEHEGRQYDPSLWTVIPLVGEWLAYWIRTRPKVCYAWVRYFIRQARKAVKMPNAGASDRSL
jgi:hypothetical protein